MILWIFLILAIIWMTIIFILSNSPSDESSKLSGKAMDLTIVKAAKLFKSNKSNTSIKAKYSTLVRKTAHFVEYMILGIIVSIILLILKIDEPVFPIFICFLYATTDEIHQLFVKGRTCRLLDVVIDTLGASLGTVIVYFFK